MVDPGGEFSFFLQSFAKNIGKIARVRGGGAVAAGEPLAGYAMGGCATSGRGVLWGLQSVAGYSGLALVFARDSALRGGFKFYFSKIFC